MKYIFAFLHSYKQDHSSIGCTAGNGSIIPVNETTLNETGTRIINDKLQ